MRHQLFVVYCDNEKQNAVIRANTSRDALDKAEEKYPDAIKIEVCSMGYFYDDPVTK
jgi:hypothetical protein